MTTDLSGEAGTPLYLRLAGILTAQIRSGEIASGEALPAERRIAEMYKVSRVTVRRALEQIATDGLVEQRHGSGNYVSQPLRQPLSVLTGFSEDIHARGMKPGSVFLDRGTGLATPEEAIALGLAPGAGVSRISRLRTADGLPLAIETATIIADALPDPASVQKSLYDMLARRGMRPVRAIQRLSAVLLDGRTARLLDVPAGSAGLFIVRVGYLASGTPVEYTCSHYRGDRWDFIAELT